MSLDNLKSRFVAFLLRLSTLISDEPLTNVAPYGECNTSPNALAWIPSGYTVRSCIKHDNIDRCWFMYTPSSVDESSEVPLVIHLHGSGGCASLPSLGFGTIANEYGFVVVWPQGTSTKQFGQDLTSWNDGSGLFGAEEAGIDDMGFLETMVDVILDENTFLDQSRVYMSGHSNGAVMAQRFSLQTNSILAGVIAFSGSAKPNDIEWSPGGESINTYNSTPIILIHGDIDNVVPFDTRKGPLAGAVDSYEGWISLNQCSGSDEPEVTDEYILRASNECANDGKVALVEVIDAGHHPISKGEEPFLISPRNVIADCPFRRAIFFYEPDCKLIELDSSRLAWEFISEFHR